MGQRDEKEKAKASREEGGKYFYGLSKSAFTVMVLGGLATLFGMGESTQLQASLFLLLGTILTIVLAYMGNKILKG